MKVSNLKKTKTAPKTDATPLPSSKPEKPEIEKASSREKRALFHSNPRKERAKKRRAQKINIPITPLVRFAWFTVGIFVIALAGFSFFLPIIKSANRLDYFDYVAELRSNVLVNDSKDYVLKAYAVEKEYPYSADGIKRDVTKRAEVYFSAPTGDLPCKITFELDGKTYGGDASYDNVKAEYFYSVSADISEATELEFLIEYGEKRLTTYARTIKTEQTLSPRAILEKLRENEPSVFESMTDENGFTGEIYLRLINEDAPYYYAGLIEKSGEIHAYLLSSTDGKILAKREA